jgi:hypothetical protein
MLAQLIRMLLSEAGIPMDRTLAAIRSPALKSFSLMDRLDFFLRK